jgi:excisionase family DNA binding protein
MTETPGTSADSDLTMARFATVAEVAKRLRVSNMTVYRLVKSGQIRAVRVGRGYRIPEQELQRSLDARCMDAG